MKRLEERLPEQLLVKADRVVTGEHRRSPPTQRLADLAHHLVVGRVLRAKQIVNGQAGDAERMRRRDDPGQQAGPDLKPADLVQVFVRADRRELNDLIERTV